MGGVAAVIGAALASGQAIGKIRSRSHARVIRQARFNSLPDQMDRMVTAIEGVHSLGEPIKEGLVDKVDRIDNRLDVLEKKFDKHLATHS